MRRAGIVVGTVAVVLALAAGIGWVFLNPHRGQAVVDGSTLPLEQVLSRGEAIRDLDFVAETIRGRHVWAADGLPEGVAVAWESERSALPAEPTVLDVWRASSRMLVALGDGHTMVGVPRLDTAPYGIDYAVRDGELQAGVAGEFLPVASINGAPVADLVERNRLLTPADNEGWIEGRLIRHLRFDDGLALLGAPPRDGYRVEVATPDGGVESIVATPAAPEDSQLPVAEYRVDDELAVFTLHRCEPDDSYEAALEGFFAEVNSRGLDRIVVDLRGNPGGSSRVTNLFVEYLDVGTIPSGSVKGRFGPWVVPLGSGTMHGRTHEPAFAGEIIALTDHDTFSSVADFAVVLSDNWLALVVGESPGSAPTGAGDVVNLRLPSSGLFMQGSYKEFERPDASRARSVLEVDVVADPTGSVEEMLEAAEG